MSIEQFIIDLLKHHNCVVVPNFGGFIANYRSAVIDNTSKTISPPSKQVIFNANLLNNDGLLANHIVEKQSISYAESLAKIDSKTREWKTSLQNSKRLNFGEIGFLYEQDGTIVFEQSRDSNLLLEAYGLSSIQFVSAKEIEAAKPSPNPTSASENKPEKDTFDVSHQTSNAPKETTIALASSEEIQTVPSEKSDMILPVESGKKSRKKWGYIAAACVIPFLFYTYWIPMETNFLETGNLQLSDFNPFHRHKVGSTYQSRIQNLSNESFIPSETIAEKVASLSADISIYSYEFSESTYIPVNIDKLDIANDNSFSIAAAVEAPIQLIAGCFSVESNANNLVAALKSNGYQAYILDKNKGLYRVAVKGFENIANAKAAKADLKAKSYSTWILKK